MSATLDMLLVEHAQEFDDDLDGQALLYALHLLRRERGWLKRDMAQLPADTEMRRSYEAAHERALRAEEVIGSWFAADPCGAVVGTVPGVGVDLGPEASR